MLDMPGKGLSIGVHINATNDEQLALGGLRWWPREYQSMRLSDKSYFKPFSWAQGMPSDTCFSPELEMRKSNRWEKRKSWCSTKHKRGLQIYAAYLVYEPEKQSLRDSCVRGL